MGRGLGDGTRFAVGVVGVAGGAGDWSRGHPRSRVVAVGVGCFGERVHRRSRTDESTEVVVGEGKAEQVGRAGIGRGGLVRELTE